MASAAATAVAALSGDSMDLVIWRAFGGTIAAGLVEAALGLNPHLLGDVLIAEASAVLLPPVTEKARTLETIKLWN